MQTQGTVASVKPGAGLTATRGKEDLLRSRIQQIYLEYSPSTTVSHVDFLLDKYKGREEEMLAFLVEKYGPEPVLGVDTAEANRISQRIANIRSSNIAEEVLPRHSGVEPTLLHRLVTQFGAESSHHQQSYIPPRALSGFADPDSALAQRVENFNADMIAIQNQRAAQENTQLFSTVAEARSIVHAQEAELDQLRFAISALQTKRAKVQEANFEEIRKVARQVTQAKLRLLDLQQQRDPTLAAQSELDQVLGQLEALGTSMNDVQISLDAVRLILSNHLALFPASPVRHTLHQMDAVVAARLEPK